MRREGEKKKENGTVCVGDDDGFLGFTDCLLFWWGSLNGRIHECVVCNVCSFSRHHHPPSPPPLPSWIPPPSPSSRVKNLFCQWLQPGEREREWIPNNSIQLNQKYLMIASSQFFYVIQMMMRRREREHLSSHPTAIVTLCVVSPLCFSGCRE